MAVVLALVSAFLGGSADFLGGTATRRYSVIHVVGLSQVGALILTGLVLLFTGAQQPITPQVIAWGIPAGMAMLLGLVSFYGALATGTMGVVAPIAALGVMVPLYWGLWLGEFPVALQIVGICVALVGVVLASGPELVGPSARRPLVLAVLAAVGFGSSMLFFAEGSRNDPISALLIMKVSIVAPLLIVIGRADRPAVDRGHGLILLLIAGADVGANLAFGYASRLGLLSIVAVLGSLYPVATVLLARWVHGERIAPIQHAGVAAALTGVVLIGLG
jgi:drug/metabolite transporter (DMT)-like permease